MMHVTLCTSGMFTSNFCHSFIDTLRSLHRIPPESTKSANPYLLHILLVFFISLLSELSKVLGHCIVLSRDCQSVLL